MLRGTLASWFLVRHRLSGHQPPDLHDLLVRGGHLHSDQAKVTGRGRGAVRAGAILDAHVAGVNYAGGVRQRLTGEVF